MRDRCKSCVRCGALRAKYEQFIAWAWSYDEESFDGRSRALHEAWMSALPCPVLRLEGETSVTEQVRRVKDYRVRRPAFGS